MVSHKISAVIIDDEDSARDVLENLLARFCPEVELVGKYPDLVSGVDGINKLCPELVFLDIEMPNYAGHEILSFFDKINFHIIFVTAYDSYALKAFEMAAVDYLLKPVDIDRLKLAVEKAQANILSKTISENFDILKDSLATSKIQNIVIKHRGDQVVIPLEDIIAIEAQESYSNIHTVKKMYVASKNLKHFESMLDDNKCFFRSHKSWIINCNKIDSYSKSKGEIVLQTNVVAKLSKYRKEAFAEVLSFQS